MDSKKIFILIISCSIFLIDVATDIILPSLKILERVFSTDIKNVEYLISANLLGLALSSLLSGMASNICDYRKSLLVGFFIFTFSSTLLCISTHLSVMILLRFLQGVGGGITTTISIALLKEVFEETDFVKALSFIGMLVVTSPAIAPPLGMMLQSNWRYSFYLIATLAVLCVTLLYITLPVLDKQKTDLQNNFRNNISQYQRIFFNKTFQTYNFISALSYSMLWLFLAYLPHYFIANSYLSVTYASSIFIPAVILASTGMLINAKIINYLNSFQCLITGIAIITFSITIFVIMGSLHYLTYSAIIILLSLYWFGTAFVFSNACDLALSAIEDSSVGSSLLIFTELLTGSFVVILTGNFYHNELTTLLIILAIINVSIQLILFSFANNRKQSSNYQGIINA